MDERADVLARARDERSRIKRLAVEKAIQELQAKGDLVTFKAVAKAASVSRQYLYNNFRDEIGGERDEGRGVIQTVDGIRVPTRSADESRHIEALLRNKIDKLEKELAGVRKKLQSSTDLLERERGKSEYWRDLYQKAREKTRS